MKILLLGANGQLGRQLAEQAGVWRPEDEIVATTRTGVTINGDKTYPLDLTDAGELGQLLNRVRPGIIINAAAYTAVDRAEAEEALATRINGYVVEELARWASMHDSLVIHYSTDYVFDGTLGAAYSPKVPPCPINAYGRSKLAGELALQASGCAYLIFRTAWVYSPHGKSFLHTMLRLGKKQPELRVVADQRGSPTPASLIAQQTYRALRRWIAAAADERARMQGIYHLTTTGTASWHEFAETIFEEALRYGLVAKRPEIIAISSEEFPTEAIRPSFSGLDTSSFCRTFDAQLPDWHDALREVMASWPESDIRDRGDCD